MCGICGMIKRNNIEEMDKKIIIHMRDALEHRGPDDAGYYADENVGLGHRRLSILDLSAAGHQPMAYGKRYVIAFNGEIYNYLELREELQKEGYEFQTKTDTEVIMAAYDFWGEKCFEKFNGMWALALRDKEKNQVILSRDRFGVKPLYYYKNDSKIIFASEIKALLKDEEIKRKGNDRIIYDYLTQGLIDHTNETFFEGIYKFPHGCYAVVDGSLDLKITNFWKLDFSEEIGKGISDKDVKKFRELFDNAIKLRMRSDVPVGSCLSGGLDSSAIVCCMNEILKEEKNAQQFTFSYRAQDEKIDESEYMQAVIEETNVNAKFVSPDATDLIKDLDSLIYYQDEPFSTTGMYAGFCVYRKAKEEHVKVLLDGQGADEFLCGYRKSRLYYLGMLKRDRRYLRFVRELFLSASQMKTSMSMKSMLKSDINKALRILRKEKQRNNISTEYYNAEFIANTKGYDYDRRDNFQYNDVFRVSLPSLLRYTDRNSMAFSVESRLPFLDFEFAEYCAKLPISAKLNGGFSKAIMRKALTMPMKIKKRKDKIGFATPEDKWIKKEQDNIKKIIATKDFRAGRYINQNKILGDWKKIVNENAIPYFFRIVCLERWMEIFEVE